MNRIWRTLVIGLSTLSVSVTSSFAVAEVTEAQRKKVRSIATIIRRAGTLFSQNRFKESAKAIKTAHSRVEELAKGGDKELIEYLDSTYRRLVRARALLELEGFDIPEIKKPMPVDPKGDKPSPAGGVSFVKQVVPILVAKCGNCHVRNARGMFSMASFETLMKGNNDGKVVFPGDADGSRIIEVITEGDMPRGGLKVAPAELAILKNWIEQGARNDGAAKANLTSLAPNVSSALPRLAVAKATGKETISFSKDIAPVLNEHCANCHGNGRRPSGRFNLTNFTAMLRGGESGPPLAPRKSAESLIIKKLKGTASGQRMPRGRDPLPDKVVAKIAKWIDEGATFDGPDATQHVEVVAALAWAKDATHEELAARRAQRSDKNWRLGMPGIDSTAAESKNYLVISSFGEETTKELADDAEKVTPQIAEIFNAPTDKPLLKGKVTLFFFKQRYDYSEFGKMVEKRALPAGWRGHWKFNVLDAYGAVIPPRRDEYTLDALLAQQVAGVYVASLGNVPDWFAEGSARMAAARVASEDARIDKWDEQVAAALGAMAKPDDFLTSKLPPEERALASYSFVRFLMKDPKRYHKVLSDLREGKAFGQAFGSAYGQSPAQLTGVWARSAGSQKRGIRRPTRLRKP